MGFSRYQDSMPSSSSLAFLACLSVVSGFTGPASSAPFVGRATSVQMSTQYGDLSTIGFKKDKKTGDSSALKGYTVGSRAPKASVNSGSKAQFGYGIGNLYGGGLADGSKSVVKSEDIKGKIDADATGTIAKFGSAWLFLVTLFILSNIGAD